MGNRSLEGRRVLVVEDDYLIAMDLESSLEEAGATVVGMAPSVEGALALIEAESPIDGAMLDMNLSGATVLPVADVLARRGVPFVFTTGYDAEAMPSRHAGAPHLSKPLDMAKVAGVLAGLIDR